jgi:bifunctional non-homologous end joining protein LigD
VIGGYTPDNPLYALIVGYHESDKLMFASKVRNGFVPRFRREVWSKLKYLQTNTCPFANLPEKKRTQWAVTREEMNGCVWLEPQLVAQIEFTKWTPDSHLRHSKFCGLRGGQRAVPGFSGEGGSVRRPAIRLRAMLRTKVFGA